MSNIRVTYSGLISFAIRLLTVITGTVFILILTRELTEVEFGTWGLISGIVIYATIINPLVTYWVTREVARGIESGKTALFFSGISSVGGTGIFIIASFFIGTTSEAEYDVLLFSSILIIPIFLNNTLNAINMGFKPQVVSYGLLVFEIVKIPAAFLFVYFINLGVYGAIWAIFFSYLASNLVLILYAKEKLKGKFEKSIVKNWLRLFWIPIYREFPSIFTLSDTVVFTIVTGSVGGVAYYTAARTIGFLVNHTRAFSTALYPKLLEGGPKEYLQDNLNRLFYFAFPLMAFSIVFARPTLFALNPIYEDVWLAVVLLTIRSFFTTINKMFIQSLQGIEKVDMQKDSRLKDYVKSKLTLYPTIELIRNGIYFSVLAAIFYIFINQTEAELVNYWALTGLIIEIPLFMYTYSLTKKSFPIVIDKQVFIKYLLVSVVTFSFIHILIEKYLLYVNRIFEFLPQVMIYTAFGIGLYFAITYLIDVKTRKLVKDIINEIKK